MVHSTRARLTRAMQLFATLAFVLPLFAALVAVAPVAAAEPTTGGAATLSGGKTVTGKRTETLPQLSASEQQKLDAALKNSNLPGPAIPEGPGAKKVTSPPTQPPAKDPPKTLPANGTNGGVKQKADDFSLFQNVALPAGAQRSTTDEPSVASHNNVVFATGNWWAAVSTDNGQTWTYIDPFTFYPAANGGFCCDQDVIYDPGRDVWVWTLQYISNAAGNTVRVATTDTAGVIANSWTYYDLTPQQMGKVAGVWLDYPNMSLSSNYFYYTSNFFCDPNCNNSSGGVTVRIALSDLHARPGGGVGYQFAFGNFTMVPTQGATSTMYMLAHQSTTQMRVYTWPEANTLPTGSTDVAHSSYNTGTHSCVTPDTFDPCARDDNRVKTAWVANNIIGAYWDVAAGAGGIATFAETYIQGIRINQAGLTLASEPYLYSSSFAFGFPGVGVNARGAIGMSVAWAGGIYYPGSAVLISDEFNSNSVPGDISYTRFGTNSPSNANRWGDFLTVRPAGGNGNAWIGVGFSLQGPCTGGGVSCANLEMRFLRWGREKDNPFFGEQALPTIFRNVGGSGVFYERNSLSTGNPDLTGVFGAGSDVPLMCDFDGNGTRTPTVYRPSQATFFMNSAYSGSAYTGFVTFGAAGDIGVCGDWTGIGHDGIGVYRNGVWYLKDNATTGNPDRTVVFGGAGDKPVVGAWNSSGAAKVGVFRNGLFYLASGNVFFPTVAYQFPYGTAGDYPIAGDWDRNGTTTIGIYRPGGAWYLNNSLPASGGNTFFVYGGAGGDIGITWR